MAGSGSEVNDLALVLSHVPDVVVVASGDDGENLLVALLAKERFGIPRVVACVVDPAMEWLCEGVFYERSWAVDEMVAVARVIVARIDVIDGA